MEYSRFYEYRVITNIKVNTKPVFSLLSAHNRMSYDSIRKPRYHDFQMLQFFFSKNQYSQKLRHIMIYTHNKKKILHALTPHQQNRIFLSRKPVVDFFFHIWTCCVLTAYDIIGILSHMITFRLVFSTIENMEEIKDQNSKNCFCFVWPVCLWWL